MPRSKEAKRVSKLVSKYRRRFGFNGPRGWTTVTCLVEKIPIDDTINALGGSDSAARVDCSPAYKQATITFDRSYVASCDDAELDRVVRHEMVHVLLSSYREFVTDLINSLPRPNRNRVLQSFVQVDERVTTDVTRVTD